MLRTIGGINVANTETRYPEVDLTTESLKEADVLLLSTEPFPFKETHRDEMALFGLSLSKIHHIDGEMCSWHGTRLQHGLRYLHNWHREIIQRTHI
jgi:hypothetical protein